METISDCFKTEFGKKYPESFVSKEDKTGICCKCKAIKAWTGRSWTYRLFQGNCGFEGNNHHWHRAVINRDSVLDVLTKEKNLISHNPVSSNKDGVKECR